MTMVEGILKKRKRTKGADRRRTERRRQGGAEEEEEGVAGERAGVEGSLFLQSAEIGDIQHVVNKGGSE